MERRKIIVIREDILTDRRLTLAEKIVYARISAFEKYYEASETCAELLGISVSSVQKAKAKLEKLGYISCLKNTGRGKVYRANLDALSDSQNWPDRLANSANQNGKICQHSIDKEEIKIDTKVSMAQAPEEFGNSDINAIFQAWLDAGLPAITSRVQANRRAIWNMLRNKQIGRERLLRGVQLAREAYGERYAPSVLSFEDLNRKLTALELWYDKQASVLTTSRPATSREYSSTYSGEITYERRPYDERPAVLDYERSDEVVSDEFLEKCRKKFM